MGMDSRIRSITKSITWRITGIWVLLALGYIITGSWEKASAISITFHLVRIVLYYVHERLWLRTKWGISNPTNMVWFWVSVVGLVLSFGLLVFLTYF
jgi:uncharacterized membrane protein